MPILAQVVGSGPAPPVVPVDNRSLEFRLLDGTSPIDWTGDEWIIMSGIQGLEIPPREIITDTVPGLDGARLREIRTTTRDVVVPFFVFSEDLDSSTHRQQMASMRRYFSYRTIDYTTAEGTFDLVASGDSGERTLRCFYVDGLEGVTGYADQGAAFYATYDVKVTAVDPYWHGDEWSTPTVTTGAGEVFLADSGSYLWPRQISPSVALGAAMHVTVTGDVPSPPSIEMVGPWTTASITSPQGLSITVGAVASGTLLIQTGRQRLVTLDGTSRWDLVGDSPQWRPLPPGDAEISIVVSGATSATSARVYGTSLWETAW